MEDTKLKFAKRKLRVQRCKTLPGGGKVVSAKPPPRPPAVPAKAAPRLQGERPPRTPVPKGDPTLGARLASLSKEERKQAKAADADRIARRAAKKKARMALTAKAGGAEDRMRVRKRLNGPKGTGGARKEVKKKVGQKKKAAK
jgi:nucleolar protein 12